MNEDTVPVFEERESFRLYRDELKQVQKVVDFSIDKVGDKKFTSKSQFYRAGIMRLLKKELEKMEDSTSREDYLGN